MLRREDESLAPFILGITSYPMLRHRCEKRPSYRAWLHYCAARGLAPRVMGMYWSPAPEQNPQGLGQFDPRAYPDYFEQVKGLAQDCLSHGIRLFFDALASLRRLPPEYAGPWPLETLDWVAMHQRLGEVLAPFPNVVYGGGNEAPFNGWDGARLMRPPAGVLCHRGTGVSEFLQPWDIWPLEGPRHGNDGRPNWIKGCKDIYEWQTGNTTNQVQMAIPVGDHEPIGIGEADRDGKTTANPRHVANYAAGCKLFGEYVILHSRAGIGLQLPGPIEGACIDAAVAAVKDSVLPNESKLGSYTRGGLPDFPLVNSPDASDGMPSWWMRAYGKISGNKAAVVILGATPALPAIQAVAPWRITQHIGDVVLLER